MIEIHEIASDLSSLTRPTGSPAVTAATVDMTNPKDRLGALKVPLRLVPGVAIVLEAFVYELGSWKYGEANWRNRAVRISVYSEAIDRHNLALRAGEDLDSESGLPHTAHIRACAGIIEDARACNALIDDRFEKDMTAFVLNSFVATNYHKKMLNQARTPCKTLAEVRKENGQEELTYEEFIGKVVANVQERQAQREARPI